MSYRIDNEGKEIVFSGWEKGISDNAFDGLADMRNVDITSGMREASVAFANDTVILPPVINLMSFTGTAASNLITVASTAGLYEGCAISIATFSGTGLNTGASTPVSISYALVGGGAAGGNARGNPVNNCSAGAGGGAGEVVQGTTTLGIGDVAVTVGDGGIPASTTSVDNGGNGEDTVLGSVDTAKGGAGGGSAGGTLNFANTGTNSLGGDGGAGGGAATDTGAGAANGGTGTFNGGNSSVSVGAHAGGGSSTAAAGQSASIGNGGDGADGVPISINGYSDTLAGAGGGGSSSSGGAVSPGDGGDGGGGTGAQNNNGTYTAPTAGTANTGSGGGGAASESGTARQGMGGGSGRAVISYLTGSMVATGGTMTTNGDYTVHTFLSDGTFSVISVGSPSVYYVRNLTATTFQLSLYPNSAIVDITADGTGTFSTYQYGNQRGLANNGSPVSYWEAPEIGGVLLCDLSNYAWLWQQTDDGASPYNSLLFLGNTTGIAAASGNQTGIAYWRGYVALIQQPATIDMLYWDNFISETGEAWSIDPLEQYTTVSLTASTLSAADIRANYVRLTPNTATDELMVTQNGSLFEAASTTTITSPSITLEAGDTLIVWACNYTATAVSGVSFDGNAMTLVSDGTGDGLRMATYRYRTATQDSGTFVVTFGSATVNRLYMYTVVSGAGTASITGDTTSGTAATSVIESALWNKPNWMLLYGALSEDTDANIYFTSPLVTLENSTGNSTGCWGTSYFTGQGQADTLKHNVPVTIGDNNILYWGAGSQYLGSLNADPNFDPGASVLVTNQVVQGGLTYNLNGQALDLPKDERIESVHMANSTLYAGATSNQIYPWDTISPSFDETIDNPEYGNSNLISANNTVYILGGNLGRIYNTNGSSVSLYKELSGEVTGDVKPYYFFWDVNSGNGELYFSFQAFQNGSATALTTTGGVWAINANTGALRMIQMPMEGYEGLTRMVCPVGHGYSQTMLRPDGQGLLLGYSIDNTHYLEFSTTAPYTNYEAYIETEIVPVGTFFAQQTFQHIEYKLSTPLVTGESIRVSQRSNLTTTYTQIAEFTNTGVISDQSSINWENVEWCQFKIELKSTATNPSYVRLRELRMR